MLNVLMTIKVIHWLAVSTNNSEFKAILPNTAGAAKLGEVFGDVTFQKRN